MNSLVQEQTVPGFIITRANLQGSTRAQTGGPVRREKNMASLSTEIYCFGQLQNHPCNFPQRAGNKRTYLLHHKPSFQTSYLPFKVSAYHKSLSTQA